MFASSLFLAVVGCPSAPHYGLGSGGEPLQIFVGKQVQLPHHNELMKSGRPAPVFKGVVQLLLSVIEEVVQPDVAVVRRRVSASPIKSRHSWRIRSQKRSRAIGWAFLNRFQSDSGKSLNMGLSGGTTHGRDVESQSRFAISCTA